MGMLCSVFASALGRGSRGLSRCSHGAYAVGKSRSGLVILIVPNGCPNPFASFVPVNSLGKVPQ